MIISSNNMPREIYYTVSNELKERGNGECFWSLSRLLSSCQLCFANTKMIGFYCKSFLNVN